MNTDIGLSSISPYNYFKFIFFKKREIKNMNIESMSHVEEKKLFESFVEDYNTASFPSKKFYDILKWEVK